MAISALLVTWAASSLQTQDATYPPPKPSLPTIEQQVVLLPESVVQTQWPHTLKLVNASQNINLLNPGECIRVGVYSTGDNRDEYLEKTKLSFRVQFSGRTDTYPLAFLSEFKQIKPEGGDFVAAALSAAGVKQPESTKTMASLGVSVDRWCTPVDSGDGTATVDAEAQSPSGHQVLRSLAIQVESFETGSKKVFTDSQELGNFLQTYYQQPNPARLLPALLFMIEDQAKQPRRGAGRDHNCFLECCALFRSHRSEKLSTAPYRTAAIDPCFRAFGSAFRWLRHRYRSKILERRGARQIREPPSIARSFRSDSNPRSISAP
jgi:hypothetical protein